MKPDALFVILCVVLLYVAWVVTGGPSRAFSTGGPFITPVTKPGEQQQAYKLNAPANPVDPKAYPKQIPTANHATSVPDPYQRPVNPDRSSTTY